MILRIWWIFRCWLLQKLHPTSVIDHAAKLEAIDKAHREALYEFDRELHPEPIYAWTGYACQNVANSMNTSQYGNAANQAQYNAAYQDQCNAANQASNAYRPTAHKTELMQHGYTEPDHPEDTANYLTKYLH